MSIENEKVKSLSQEEQEFLDWLKNTDDETFQRELDAAYSEVLGVVGQVKDLANHAKAIRS